MHYCHNVAINDHTAIITGEYNMIAAEWMYLPYHFEMYQS